MDRKLGYTQENQGQILISRAIELTKIIIKLPSLIELEVHSFSLLDSGPLSEIMVVLRAPGFQLNIILS